MQRNMLQEVLVALFAVFALAFLTIFAVLLTEVPVADADLTSTVESMSSAAFVPEETQNLDNETATSTPSPSATESEEPTAVSSLTSTATSEPPTSTTFPTRTHTVTPTHTETSTEAPTVTASRTPRPPLQTSTVRPSVTPSRIPATVTALPTQTPTARPPTLTPRPSRTVTVVPVLATVQMVVSPSPRPTRVSIEITPRPSSTQAPAQSPTDVFSAFAGILPTLPASPTVALNSVSTRQPSTCKMPDNWVAYDVQPGDTLFALALVINSSVDELRYANCIADADTIAVGDVIFLPRHPTTPVPTAPSANIRAGLTRVGCSDSHAQITSPIALQRVSGLFSVFGTAVRDDFWYYKLEIRPDWADVYNFYSDSYIPVTSGRLGEINSRLFNKGLYWIRLSIVDASARIPDDGVCEIPVVFE